ncbi:helix-turn-helix transcriptional regulator [Actinoplanes bogorensis]|uniref:Helix-turn-helix transcriptional regulator n=1 Tax=Paractinoplanes bogorensis TaxID=1610840 RepID=A0ABS5Z1D6_9ACTN|nr:helix-turn-helix domain-containing protein [Actinoplanes bogorensis]MBU2669508.1 helix-turn-helix transcriptional regulator [Actinoplanes bogorensis]
MPRTYDDPCGLARALNVVGERWALLIVRELLLGPKRFTDLRRGLPGASQSMLTSRLAELEQAGVLRRRRLGPPVASQVYELTARGQDLSPALVALSAWGSREPTASSEELSVDALALAMRTTFVGASTEIRAQLNVDADHLQVVVAGPELTITRGEMPDPDVTITTTATTWRSVIFGGWPLDPASVTGDRDAAAHLVTLFPRPSRV